MFSETGRFLALDLGGTNFRVLIVNLEGRKVTMENQIFPISDKLMKGPGVDVRLLLLIQYTLLIVIYR